MPAPIKEVPLQKSKTENIKLINCNGDFEWVPAQIGYRGTGYVFFVVDNAL